MNFFGKNFDKFDVIAPYAQIIGWFNTFVKFHSLQELIVILHLYLLICFVMRLLYIILLQKIIEYCCGHPCLKFLGKISMILSLNLMICFNILFNELLCTK